MTTGLLSFLLMQAVSLLLDATVRPRQGVWHRSGRRSWQGLSLHLLAMTGLFGLFLAISGSGPVAGILAAALLALVVTASNSKHAMLGEPLLFSDLALFAALFRHPTFYLSALSRAQKIEFVCGALALLAALVWLFVASPAPHLAGTGLMLVGAVGIQGLLHGRACAMLAPRPDADADLARHGLIAFLLLYWSRWRGTVDPPVRTTAFSIRQREHHAPDVIVVVQCESFADPVALTGDASLGLPGLKRARAMSCQWGELHVSGFGAYTMRTEFGVLFGRSETELGFRRYDPFLTARGEASYALSARLGDAGYECLFVHPHDLRFYARDRLMPAIGFNRMVGEDRFPPARPGDGRYVDDRTLGAALCELVDEATAPTFLYAVTMENHGPWMKDRLPGSPGGIDAYLRHVRSSDAMLDGLIDHLADLGRSALLVFFGDHRPSIPGVVEPGPVRHTPYVMVRFPAEGEAHQPRGERVDLTPDALHHVILRMADQPGRDG